MTLLELVIIAHRCRSTHHFIAIDALKLLKGKNADVWHDLMLRHHESLLKGAKAPDAEFKDFKNHVLHISEGEWGGARDAAMDWYGRAVAALRAEKWSKAAYALGVLTHYYADPIQPFHTAQSEEEGVIHRALEWSIAKSRHKIEARIEEMGYPTIEAGESSGFVSDMVRAGAERSHPYYQTLIDRYDFHAGVKDPEAGLDETLINIIAELVAYATAGVAVLFDRAFAEAAVKPQKVDLDLPGYLAALDIPIRRVTKRMSDARDRRKVEAMYEELQTTGKVIKTLPADDKAIRKLHAEQVLRKPLRDLDAQALKPIGVKHGSAEIDETATPKQASKSNKDTEVTVSEPAPAPQQQAKSPSKTELRVVKPAPKPAMPEQPSSEAAALTPPAEAAFVDAQASEAPQEETAAAAVLAELPEPDPAPKTALKPGPKTEPLAETAAVKPAASVKSSETETEDKAPTLTRACPVVDAPSIGPKTAARLEKVGIVTVGDLMDAAPEETANALEVRYIKSATVQEWQDQTGLMLAMPGLRVLDSQILVGAGIRSADDLAKASARKVLTAATEFLDTPSGSRILWGGENNVDEGEVRSWIALAKSSAA